MCEPTGSRWTLTSRVALGSPGKEQMAPSAAQRRFENSSHPDDLWEENLFSWFRPTQQSMHKSFGRNVQVRSTNPIWELKGCTKKCWFGRFSTNMGAYFQELKLALQVFGYVKPGSSGKEPQRPAFATGLKSGLSWHENHGEKRRSWPTFLLTENINQGFKKTPSLLIGRVTFVKGSLHVLGTCQD